MASSKNFDRKIEGGWTYPDHNDYCWLCGGVPLSLKRNEIRLERQRRFDAMQEELSRARFEGMTHKIWRTVGGPRVRESHMDANNQKVFLDSHFRIGDEFLFLPSDPNASFAETANCRCEVKYVKEEPRPPVVAPSPKPKPTPPPRSQESVQTPRGQVVPDVNALWPSRYDKVTSRFSAVQTVNQRRHTAIDIRNPLGEPVFATLDGVVKEIGSNARSGNFVKITHVKGLESSYSHTRVVVGKGQIVQRGQVIGFSDDSGSGPPHLHFVIRLNGERIDPLLLFLQRR